MGDFKEDEESLVLTPGYLSSFAHVQSRLFIQFSLAKKPQTELGEMIITGVIQFKEQV